MQPFVIEIQRFADAKVYTIRNRKTSTNTNKRILFGELLPNDPMAPFGLTNHYICICEQE